MAMNRPMTTSKLRKMKSDGVPITMITAYDYPTAYLAEQAGIDTILVGDSLGNVVQGNETTIPVTIDEMVYHTKMVTRAVSNAFVIADMPFNTYHGSIDNTLRHAGRLMQEGLAKAVKMEGGVEIVDSVKACVQAGIPVVGHIGLTPQSIYQIGGFKVQGKDSEGAQKLMNEAKALEEAGAFCIVLELVTEELAAWITKELSIPTIGIGASAACDGQVLVFHDIFQFGPSFPKKMVKTYGNLNETIVNGIGEYIREVKSREFPAESNTFKGDSEVLTYLYGASNEDPHVKH